MWDTLPMISAEQCLDRGHHGRDGENILMQFLEGQHFLVEERVSATTFSIDSSIIDLLSSMWHTSSILIVFNEISDIKLFNRIYDSVILCPQQKQILCYFLFIHSHWSFHLHNLYQFPYLTIFLHETILIQLIFAFPTYL